jgi:hypothetical protein
VTDGFEDSVAFIFYSALKMAVMALKCTGNGSSK